MKKNLAKRLLAGALAAAVACTTVISSDMTALAADKKAKANTFFILKLNFIFYITKKSLSKNLKNGLPKDQL